MTRAMDEKPTMAVADVLAGLTRMEATMREKGSDYGVDVLQDAGRYITAFTAERERLREALRAWRQRCARNAMLLRAQADAAQSERSDKEIGE